MPYSFVDAAQRAKKIKRVVLDVHGVLTSGAFLCNEEGVTQEVAAEGAGREGTDDGETRSGEAAEG